MREADQRVHRLLVVPVVRPELSRKTVVPLLSVVPVPVVRPELSRKTSSITGFGCSTDCSARTILECLHILSMCCPCCQEQRSKDYRSGAHGHNLKFVGYRMIQAVVAEIDIEAAIAWGVASRMLVYAVGSGR